MLVHVKTLDGVVTSVEVEPTDTIERVRKRTLERANVAQRENVLILPGPNACVLDEAKTLADYGITDGTTLHRKVWGVRGGG